jgi:hypothetical protein
MGFLEAGTPLTWTDSLEFVKYGAHCGDAGAPLCSSGAQHAFQERPVRSTWGLTPASPQPPRPALPQRAVREHGIQQFINTYNRIKDRTNDVLKWGDEVRASGRRRG